MRVKLQFWATVLTVVGIVAGVLCKKLFPQYWTDWYIVVLAFYWLVEMVMSFVLERFEPYINQPTLKGKNFMRTYLIAKAVKLALTLALIVVGIALMGSTQSTEAMVFAGSAVAFYLLHLAAETYIVTKKK